MLVWRAAANHKYANVFLHPVTNEIAPGYLNVVSRSGIHSNLNKYTVKDATFSNFFRISYFDLLFLSIF